MSSDTYGIGVEFRADQTRESVGRLVGTVATYGERARDRPEVFDAGSLVWPDGGIVLRDQHDRKQPIIRFTPTVEAGRVRADIALPDTQRGRDAAVSVRNGTMTRIVRRDDRASGDDAPRGSGISSGPL